MPGAPSGLPLRNHQSDQQRRKFELQRTVDHRDKALVAWARIPGLVQLFEIARLQFAVDRRNVLHSEHLQSAGRLCTIGIRRAAPVCTEWVLPIAVHAQPAGIRLAGGNCSPAIR